MKPSSASATSPRAPSQTEFSWYRGFGALFALDMKNSRTILFPAPMALAQTQNRHGMDVHSTVGGDLVNHCVNDILVQARSRSFSRLSRPRQNESAHCRTTC